MIDGTEQVSYLDEKNSVCMLNFRHFFNVISVMMSERDEPHNGYITESEELRGHSAKSWLPGHGKLSQLNDRLRQKAPRRYFTFSFYQ